MFEPKITAEINSSVLVRVEVPQFELTLDVGDGDCPEGNRDFVGVFETEVSSHSVSFHGPTPAHVVGLANLYAQKLTGAKPYELLVDFAPEVPRPSLP